MKVLMYSNFSQKEKDKKMNLQAQWEMEDFTLPSVRARFQRAFL
jgi:hypothetical protein